MHKWPTEVILTLVIAFQSIVVALPWIWKRSEPYAGMLLIGFGLVFFWVAYVQYENRNPLLRVFVTSMNGPNQGPYGAYLRITNSSPSDGKANLQLYHLGAAQGDVININVPKRQEVQFSALQLATLANAPQIKEASFFQVLVEGNFTGGASRVLFDGNNVILSDMTIQPPPYE